MATEQSNRLAKGRGFAKTDIEKPTGIFALKPDLRRYLFKKIYFNAANSGFMMRSTIGPVITKLIKPPFNPTIKGDSVTKHSHGSR